MVGLQQAEYSPAEILLSLLQGRLLFITDSQLIKSLMIGDSTGLSWSVAFHYERKSVLYLVAEV